MAPPSRISRSKFSAANQPNPSLFVDPPPSRSLFGSTSSFSFPTSPCCNPVSTTENMPNQAASRPSFFSTTPFTFPEDAPASVPNSLFEMQPSCSGLHNHVPISQCRGSCIAPYVPTPASEIGQLVSISAMPAYSDKSHEELRAEDYKLRNWSAEKPFEFSSTMRASTHSSPRYYLFGGQPSTGEGVFSSSKCSFQSESSTFGSKSSTNQKPWNPFQMNGPRSNFSGSSSGGTSSFSFPTSPYCNPISTAENMPYQAASRPTFFSTTPFTFPQVTPASVPKNPFEMKPSSSGLHIHVPNGQCQGSLLAPYIPTPASEIGVPAGQLVSISAMPAYSDKSHEELRSEDYKLRSWTKDNPFEFSSTSRASADPSPKFSLFGQPSACEGTVSSSKCGFQSEASIFGDKSSTNQQPSNAFEVNAPTSNSSGGTSLFSFPPFPYSNPISTTEHTPSQASSRPSFFSTMPFTFPQATTPASAAKNPFEIKPSSSGLHGFQSESSPFGSKSSNQQPSSPLLGNTPTSNPFGQPYQPGNHEVPFGVTTLPGFGQPYQPGNRGVNWSSPSVSTTNLPGFSSHYAGTLSSMSQDKTGFRGSATCNQCNNTFATTSSVFPGTSPGFSAQPLRFAYPSWPITGWGTPAVVPSVYPLANPPSILAPYPMGFVGSNAFCGPQSIANTSVPPTNPYKVPNTPLSFGSPVEVFKGSPNEPQPTNKEQATESKTATTSNSADHHEDKDKADNVASVPKGLEIIVENLGVNPWAESSDRNNTTKEILACEEADKDEAIIALAEFAVEQHSAMNQGSKMSMTRVVGACLEAVECGRYHIVIETKDAADEVLKRIYAVVLQRRTDLQTVVLLEKWLPGEPKSLQDSSM